MTISSVHFLPLTCSSFPIFLHFRHRSAACIVSWSFHSRRRDRLRPQSDGRSVGQLAMCLISKCLNSFTLIIILHALFFVFPKFGILCILLFHIEQLMDVLSILEVLFICVLFFPLILLNCAFLALPSSVTLLLSCFPFLYNSMCRIISSLVWEIMGTGSMAQTKTNYQVTYNEWWV